MEHKGHILYCDNYYSSPELFLQLRTLGLGTCGTVRTNRRGIPESFKSKKSLDKGEVKTCQSSDLLVLQWQDKKKVTVISTVHDDSMVVKRRRTRFAAGGTDKPAAIQEYNTVLTKETSYLAIIHIHTEL